MAFVLLSLPCVFVYLFLHSLCATKDEWLWCASSVFSFYWFALILTDVNERWSKRWCSWSCSCSCICREWELCGRRNRCLRGELKRGMLFSVNTSSSVSSSSYYDCCHDHNCKSPMLLQSMSFVARYPYTVFCYLLFLLLLLVLVLQILFVWIFLLSSTLASFILFLLTRRFAIFRFCVFCVCWVCYKVNNISYR